METILKTFKDNQEKVKTQIILKDGKIIRRTKKQGLPPEDVFLEEEIGSPTDSFVADVFNERKKDIPSFEKVPFESVSDYIEENVRDLDSIKEVLKELIRSMIIEKKNVAKNVPVEQETERK